MRRTLDIGNPGWIDGFRSLFRSQDFLRDGRAVKRPTIGTRAQAGLAVLALAVLGVSTLGAPSSVRVAQRQPGLRVVDHAVEGKTDALAGRQALIAAMLGGRLSPSSPALAALVATDRPPTLVAAAQPAGNARYTAMLGRPKPLDIASGRLVAGGMGGPYQPVAAADATPVAAADQQFHSLFVTWQKLDSVEHGVIAIPAIHPVSETTLTFSSYFGVRSDPFNGTATMHAGVDIPGPVGTPIYATADGIVDRAGRDGGYGNMVELNHGKGIQTRYGHLSKILVTENERVKRGELIALMGSTGRSTGSHLHYEVRIDGRAVNPMPFLQTADYMVAMQDTAKLQPAAATNVPTSED